jgi:tryptophan halogenase
MEIVVAGGGTAGWLTALYAQHICPKDNITLIESEEVGILGAGEGSTPQLPWILYGLGISESELIKYTNATFKSGISFENWRGDGKKYFHSFGIPNSILSPYSFTKTRNTLTSGLPENGQQYTFINGIANGDTIDNISLNSKMAYNNKSPFVNKNGNINFVTTYSYHFDASLLAKFLRMKAEERGVKRIEGKITDIISNEDGGIGSIKCDDIEVKTDFVFDCTGFARLFIGKHFGVEWKSYQDKLKVNTAIPFFLPKSDTLPPYTKAIAMKYGWLWQIPLQNRWGCGYVFDDKYINVEEAKKEVEGFIGQEIKINKIIPFNAGRYVTPWVKNCVAVGLSSTFTEPIEATSIWLIITQLRNLSPDIIHNMNEYEIEDYNKLISDVCETTTDFLQLHYITDRNDTDFWKDYQKTTTLSPKMKRRLENWKHRTPNRMDTDNLPTQFEEYSWFVVANGNGIIDKSVYEKENREFDLNNKLGNWLMQYHSNINYAESISYTHEELIDLIRKDEINLN